MDTLLVIGRLAKILEALLGTGRQRSQQVSAQAVAHPSKNRVHESVD